MEPHEMGSAQREPGESTQQQESVPDARDLEVYRLAKVERQSTRVIAKIFGVSQTRVRQIIDRAEAFMLAVAPSSKDKEVRGKCVRVAEKLAADRVDYLYGVALDKFRREELPAKGKKGKQGTKGPQYLLAAARLAYLGSKLPVSQFVSLMAESIVEGEWDGDEANAAGLPPG